MRRLHGVLIMIAALTSWKGRDDAGRELPSGIYFTRFEAAGERQSGKLTLIR